MTIHRPAIVSLPPLALATALMLAGCGSTPPADNMAEAADAVAANEIVANAVDEAPVEANDTAEADDTPAPAVVAVPPVAAKAPATQSAPVAAAAKAEAEIAKGAGITRVRRGDGWAWMRGGQVIRTASADGREVAYFRGGEDRPYFVQRGDQGYAYAGDRVTQAFGRDGRPQAIDPTRDREARQAVDRARHVRDEARQPHTSGDRIGGDRRPTPQPTATPTPTPTPTPTATGRPDRDSHNRPQRPDARATPAPTPTPDRTRPPRGDDGDRHDRPRG